MNTKRCSDYIQHDFVAVNNELMTIGVQNDVVHERLHTFDIKPLRLRVRVRMKIIAHGSKKYDLQFAPFAKMLFTQSKYS